MIYVGLSYPTFIATFLNSPLHSFRSHVCIVRNLIDNRVLSNVLTCRNVSSTQKGRGTFHPRFRGPRALDGRMFDLETAQSPVSQFSTALSEETPWMKGIRREVSQKFPPPPSLPLFHRMETMLVVGFYFQRWRVLRSFPFPLAQRMPLKYIFLSVLFHCIVFHGYTVCAAMYTSPSLPYSIQQISYHPARIIFSTRTRDWM